MSYYKPFAPQGRRDDSCGGSPKLPNLTASFKLLRVSKVVQNARREARVGMGGGREGAGRAGVGGGTTTFW